MASMRFEDETTDQVCMMMHDAAYVEFFRSEPRGPKPHVDDGFIEKTIYVAAQRRNIGWFGTSKNIVPCGSK